MAKVTRTSGKTVDSVSGAAAASADTSDHVLIAAETGQQILIDKLTVTNLSATDTVIVWKSNGSVIWYTPAPKGGGAVEPFPTALPGGLSGDLSYALLNALSSVYVCAAGYKQPNS